MNTNSIKNLITAKSIESPVFCEDSMLNSLTRFLGQQDIAAYLRHCLPGEVIDASGVRLLPLEAIQQEMAEGAAPGSFIGPFGYLVVATSVGGNAVCFHSPSGKVFWADHVSFGSNCISFKDKATGKWIYLYEYNSENVQKALVLLSNDIENFLNNLLTDKLNDQLDALD